MGEWVSVVSGLGGLLVGAAIDRVKSRVSSARLLIKPRLTTLTEQFSPAAWPPGSGERTNQEARYHCLSVRNAGEGEARDCFPLLFFVTREGDAIIKHRTGGLWTTPSGLSLAALRDISEYEVAIPGRTYAEACCFVCAGARLWIWDLDQGSWVELLQKRDTFMLIASVHSSNAPNVRGWIDTIEFIPEEMQIEIKKRERISFRKRSADAVASRLRWQSLDPS